MITANKSQKRPKFTQHIYIAFSKKNNYNKIARKNFSFTSFNFYIEQVHFHKKNSKLS